MRDPRQCRRSGKSLRVPFLDWDSLRAPGYQTDRCPFSVPGRNAFVRITRAVIEPECGLPIRFPLYNRQRSKLRDLVRLRGDARASRRVSFSRLAVTAYGSVPNVTSKVNIALVINGSFGGPIRRAK